MLTSIGVLVMFALGERGSMHSCDLDIFGVKIGVDGNEALCTGSGFIS